MSEEALINLDVSEDCGVEMRQLIKKAHNLGLLGRVNAVKRTGWMFLEHGEHKAWMNNEVQDYLRRAIEKKECEKGKAEEVEKALREKEMTGNDGDSWSERRDADMASRGRYIEMLMEQAKTIVGRGYLPYCEKSEAEFFAKYIEPLAKKIYSYAEELPNFEKVRAVGRIPLVLTIPFNVVQAGAQIRRIRLDGVPADPFPIISDAFRNLFGSSFLDQDPYVIIDVDDGSERLDLPSRELANLIRSKKRHALTIEEMFGLLAHRPEILEKHAVLCEIYPAEVVPYLYLYRKTPTFSWLQYPGHPGSAAFGMPSYGAAIGKDFILPNIVGVDGV